MIETGKCDKFLGVKDFALFVVSIILKMKFIFLSMSHLLIIMLDNATPNFKH